MRGYEGWTFRDRSFAGALTVSVLWHLFWFFSVTVVVKQPPKPRVRPLIVSLGPVFDDKIFRTLIETRPELSQTFYRRLSDYDSPAEPAAEPAARYAPGQVVSLPLGQRLWDSMRDLIGGARSAPEDDLYAPLAHSLKEEERRRREEKERELGLIDDVQD